MWIRSSVVALLVGMGSALPASAQSTQGADANSDVSVFVSQRLWFANWDQRLVEVQLVAPPGPGTPGVVSTGYLHSASTATMPITALGVRKGKFIAAASKFFDTSFPAAGNTTTGRSRRDELDLSIGYQFVPALTVSLIRKTGSISDTFSTSTTNLLGGAGRTKVSATLAGLSGNGALSGRLSLYGNLAAGPGHLDTDPVEGPPTRLRVRYVIADFGLAYRIGEGLWGGAIDAMTVQMGFRTQSLYIGRAPFEDLQENGLVVIDRQNKGRTSTEGVIMSLSFVF